MPGKRVFGPLRLPDVKPPCSDWPEPSGSGLFLCARALLCRARRVPPQGQDGRLAGAEEADRERRGAETGAGMADQSADPPEAPGKALLAAQMRDDGRAPGKADLSGMGMSRKIEIVFGRRRGNGEVRRMNEGDAEIALARGKGGERRPRRLGIEAIDVVRAGDPQPAAGAPERHSLVHQHADAQLFERLQEFVRIMVPECRDDAVTGRDGVAQQRYVLEDAALGEGAAMGEAEIAGDGAEIDRKPADERRSRLPQPGIAVEMRVAEMQDPVTVEGRRQ